MKSANKLVDRKVHFFLLLRNKNFAKKGTREFLQLGETAKINTFTLSYYVNSDAPSLVLMNHLKSTYISLPY